MTNKTRCILCNHLFSRHVRYGPTQPYYCLTCGAKAYKKEITTGVRGQDCVITLGGKSKSLPFRYVTKKDVIEILKTWEI